MATLTRLSNKLNASKVGLYFKFEANEVEDILYIVKASEAVFDSELDEDIEHLAKYNSIKGGDFRGWVCVNASQKAQSLVSALNRYWKKKERSVNCIVITQHTAIKI